MALPTDVLGKEYIIPAWKANDKDGGSMLGTVSLNHRKYQGG